MLGIMRIVNMDPDTGIRYGTIYLNNLDGDTAAYLFDEGRNVSEDEAIEEIRRWINAEIDQEIEDGRYISDIESDPEWEFERRLDRALQNLQIEEPTIKGTCDGVEYMITWLGGAPLLWVFKSPFTGKFDLCSPCVPNACNLDSPNPDGYEGYTVPADWLPKEESE